MSGNPITAAKIAAARRAFGINVDCGIFDMGNTTILWLVPFPDYSPDGLASPGE